MNGSSSAKSTPANARRTGKPSPSKPCGAVVMLLTVRARDPGASITRGRIVISLTVTAGISTTEGRAGSFDVLNPLNYYGYSICDGQSGPFSHTFKKLTSAQINTDMQLYTIEGNLAIPGNMGSGNYDVYFNTVGVRWILIGTQIWLVNQITGKLTQHFSNCL